MVLLSMIILHKVGPVQRTDRARLRALFEMLMEDVLEQLTEEYQDQMASLSASDVSSLRTSLKFSAECLFRDYFNLPSRKPPIEETKHP